jgi:mono/diheme cytochrome c family protein
MKKPISLILVFAAVAVFVSFALQESAAQPSKDKGTGAAAVYQKQCAKCHKADGKGLASLEAPDFTTEKWQKAHTDAQIAKGIREGKDTMPGFKDTLSAAQITALVKHIRSFGPAAKSAKK